MTSLSFSVSWLQLLIGFLLAALVSAAAFRSHNLSRSGALAATVLGTLVFGIGGLTWAALLLGFFISSSAFSRQNARRKAAVNEKFSKGNQRDAGQVLANGGIAGLFALLQAFFPETAWPFLGAAAALAAANADTWATELGVLSRDEPRLITSGQKVERGTSGGITREGTLAALSGALFIGVLAVIVWPTASRDAGFGILILRVGIIGLVGLAGSLVDSTIGATVQAIYHCPICNKETERHPLHLCGTPTTLKRGLPWLNNDWVNMACTTSAAILILFITALLPGLIGLASI